MKKISQETIEIIVNLHRTWEKKNEKSRFSKNDKQEIDNQFKILMKKLEKEFVPKEYWSDK